MKKKVLLIWLAAGLVLVALYFLILSPRLFFIPKETDKIVIVTANYSLPPQYQNESKEVITQKDQVTELVQQLNERRGQLEFGPLPSGASTTTIKCYQGEQKIYQIIIYADCVEAWNGLSYRVEVTRNN